MYDLIKGDFRFFWPENIQRIGHIPFAWDNILNTGLGTSSLSSLWITSYLNFTTFFSRFGFSWGIISSIFWILPPIIFSFLSAFLLFKYLFPQYNRAFGFFAGLLYLLNTYFLLIFFGGQLGVCLAYSIMPFVLLRFLMLLKEMKLRNSIFFALIFSLELLFDPRVVYMTVITLGIYWVFIFSLKNFKQRFLYLIFIPGFTTFLLHSYWIMPLLITHGASIPNGYTSSANLAFFSFADFSHVISLLHPNWPDNIFGKVYFLQPEFILLPLLAYASLLFLKRIKTKMDLQNDKNVLFFLVIGLLGAFLAKGINAPFGQIYIFSFSHIPGFQVFRDPTKWYMIIVLSYAMLIPYTIAVLYEKITHDMHYEKRKKALVLYLILFVSFLLFLIRSIFTPSIASKFLPKPVPKDYVQLKDFLFSQKNFSRTLWIPQLQRYGYFSDLHPAIGREEFFQSSSISSALRFLQRSGTLRILQEASVKYVIVPDDSQGELFVHDYKYDNHLYQQMVASLEKISYLHIVKQFGRIVVFEVPDHRNHFFSDANLTATYTFVNPTQYAVDVSHARKGNTLVFSEGYDPQWVATFQGKSIHSEKYNMYFNSFQLPESGTYQLIISYQPQVWVTYAFFLSLLTGISMLGFLILL